MDSKYLDLIVKDLSGSISEEEKQILWKWLPENRESYNEIKKIWESSDEKVPEFSPEIKWEALKSRIEGEKKQIKAWTLRIAASIVAIILAGSTYFYLNQEKQKEIPLAAITPKSEQQFKVFYLPDSSIIWLNKNSKIIVSDNFNVSDRKVALEGEAFFHIKSDSEKPFYILAGNSTTKVVGTAFNIEAYPGEDVRIAVESGKVEFYLTDHKAAKLILSPMDIAVSYHKGGIELISGEKNLLTIEQVKEKINEWTNRKESIQRDKIEQEVSKGSDAFTISF